MKTLLIISTLFMSINLHAYQIKNSWWEGSGDTRHKATNVVCNSSKTITIQYYPLTDRYLYYGKSYNSFSSAVNSICVKRVNTRTKKRVLPTNFTKISHGDNIKKTSTKALVCKTKKDIESCLSGNVMFEMCQQSAALDYKRLGNSNWRKKELKKECFILKNQKVIYVKSHKNKNSLDNYIEIKDGQSRIFYIKDSDII